MSDREILLRRGKECPELRRAGVQTDRQGGVSFAILDRPVCSRRQQRLHNLHVVAETCDVEGRRPVSVRSVHVGPGEDKLVDNLLMPRFDGPMQRRPADLILRLQWCALPQELANPGKIPLCGAARQTVELLFRHQCACALFACLCHCCSHR
eukprot:scaffold614_cov255-Pinguiococcus_pyrenoidosus.AAC.7